MTSELDHLDERIRLVELVDRVLDRGVVLRGEVTISVAGVDLVYLQLRLLLSGVEGLHERERRLGSPPPGGPPRGPPPRGSPPGGSPPGGTPTGPPPGSPPGSSGAEA